MNKVILMGRLTADPEIRYSSGNNAVARYTLAVDRKFKKDGEQNADFIGCITFNKAAEFVEKYLHKGDKITVSGRIQTGSYTNKEGRKVYTTDVIVEEHEFAESKFAQQQQKPNMENTGVYHDSNLKEYKPSDIGEGFMNIPDDIDDVPFL